MDLHAQVGNLVPCMRNALLRGYIAPPVLAPRIVSARNQWLEWHHDFALNQLPEALAEDAAVNVRVEEMDNRAEVFTLNDQETALQVCPEFSVPVKQSCCDPGSLCMREVRSSIPPSSIPSISFRIFIQTVMAWISWTFLRITYSDASFYIAAVVRARVR